MFLAFLGSLTQRFSGLHVPLREIVEAIGGRCDVSNRYSADGVADNIEPGWCVEEDGWYFLENNILQLFKSFLADIFIERSSGLLNSIVNIFIRKEGKVEARVNAL